MLEINRYSVIPNDYTLLRTIRFRLKYYQGNKILNDYISENFNYFLDLNHKNKLILNIYFLSTSRSSIIWSCLNGQNITGPWISD